MQFHAQLAAEKDAAIAAAIAETAAFKEKAAQLEKEHAKMQAELEKERAKIELRKKQPEIQQPELEQQPTAAAVQETPELEQHPTAAFVQETPELELQITAAVPIDRTSASFARTRQTARQQTDSRAVRVEPAAEPAFHPDCSIYDPYSEDYHDNCLEGGCCHLQCEGIIDGVRCTEGGQWETMVHPFGYIRLCFECGEGHCLGSGEEADCPQCSYYVRAEEEDNHSRASSADNHSGASTPVN